MTRLAGARVCRYSKCKHNSNINLDNEKYVYIKNNYYHEDCYKEKCDLQLLRDLWVNNISTTVVHSQLNKTLNQLMENGVSSDYLVFVLQYVLNNHCKLNYPAGFKYYVDNKNIRDAYVKRNQKKICQSEFVAKDNDDDAPKFSIKPKSCGFKNILGGR